MKKNWIKQLTILFVITFMVLSIGKTMPISASDSEMPFTDVTKGRWFYDYVKYVYDKKIMTGLNATTFGPDDNVTRAMVVTVLWRLAGEPDPVNTGKVFPDVPTGKWYSEAVAWAKENKIVGGYQNGFFGTNDNIIRQDFVKILKGYMDYIDIDIPIVTSDSYTSKPDANEVSGYAKEYVQWAYQREIIGQGSNLNPKGMLSRAEAATMIMRFDKKVEVAKIKGVIANGKCGDDVTWLLYDDGTLEISGTGKMYDFQSVCFDAPNWRKEYVKNVVIKDGITYIGRGVFSRCVNLKRVQIPGSVISIGQEAFYCCTGLTGIVLPNDIFFIGEKAFFGCTGLTNIIIPENLYVLKKQLFRGCENLKSVTFGANAQTVQMEEGPFASCSSLETITLPPKIEKVSAGAFTSCYKLKSIIIPEGVKSIGSGAFIDCDSLTEIDIPESVTRVVDGAFWLNDNLKKVVLSEALSKKINRAYFPEDCVFVVRGS